MCISAISLILSKKLPGRPLSYQTVKNKKLIDVFALILGQKMASEPVEFHVIEDGKLIILGAYSAKSSSDGLYLDCTPNTPEVEWIYPVQNGNVLMIEQVYSATQSGNVLEVE